MLKSLPKRQIVETLLTRGSSTIFSFVLMLVLARILSTEEYGVYAMLFSVASALGLVMTLGQNFSLLKHYRAEESPDSTANAKLVHHNFVWLGFGCSALAAIGLLGPVANGELPGSSGSMALVVSFAAIFLFSEYLQGYFRVRGRYLMALMPRENLWRILASAFVALAVSAGLPPTGHAAFAVVGLCLFVTVAVQAIAFFRDTGFGWMVHAAAPSAELRRIWRRENWSFFLNTAVNASAGHIETILVGLVIGLKEAAFFFVAKRLTMLLYLPSISIETVGMPMVSERLRHVDREGAQQLIASLSLIAFVLASLGALALAPASPYILDFFNPEFAINTPVLILMVLAVWIDAYFGMGTGILMVAGGERFFLIYRSTLMALHAMALVAGGYWLGLLGVAAAMVGYNLAECVIGAIWCRRRLGIDITATAFFSSGLDLSTIAGRMPKRQGAD